MTTATQPKARGPLWPLALLAALVLAIMLSSLLLGAALLYRPQLHIRIVDGDLSTFITTRGETVAVALAQAGISLRAGDAIQPPLTARLTSESEITIERARLVTLSVDGQAQTFITRLTSPLAFLASADIERQEQDRIYLDGSLANESALAASDASFTSLDLRRALPISIIDGEHEQLIYSHAATVGEALIEAGVTLYEHDRLAPAPRTPLSSNMRIRITRAKAIDIYGDGRQQRAFVEAQTIEGALAEAGWTLGSLDYTRPSQETHITEGMRVNVVRVREEISEQREAIPYEIGWLADSGLELDERRYVGGQTGERIRRYHIRYEDGVESQREQTSIETVRAPQNEINYYGTRVVLRTLDTEFGTLEYWRVIRMEITSYHPSEMANDPAITATGQVLTKGIVATHPEVIPYHTRVYVPGYGIGQVEDTGYGLSTTRRWLDLGYDDENYVPWRKQENVYLLTPVPAEIPYILPP